MKKEAAGYVDIIDRRTVSGWASPPQAVAVSVNGAKVGEARITEAREDARSPVMPTPEAFSSASPAIFARATRRAGPIPCSIPIGTGLVSPYPAMYRPFCISCATACSRIFRRRHCSIRNSTGQCIRKWRHRSVTASIRARSNTSS